MLTGYALLGRNVVFRQVASRKFFLLLSFLTFLFAISMFLVASRIPYRHSLRWLPKRGLCIRSWDGGIVDEAEKLGAETSISLVTQGSLGYITDFIRLAKSWEGPVTVAFYLKKASHMSAIQSVLRVLKRCEPEMMYRTRIILFYETSGQFCRESEKNDWFSPRLLCAQYFEAVQFLVDHIHRIFPRKLPNYPVNIGRNLAKSLVLTQLELVVDIELMPRRHLHRDLKLFFSYQDTSTPDVYVIPLFEVLQNESNFLDMETLRAMKGAGQVVPFHFYRSYECHRVPYLEAWWRFNESEVGLVGSARWRKPCWEPVFVSRSGTPPYDESFRGYGLNKVQQVYELCRAGYRFRILGGAFFTHLGRAQNQSDPDGRLREVVEFNEKLFKRHKKRMRLAYPDSKSRLCD